MFIRDYIEKIMFILRDKHCIKPFLIKHANLYLGAFQ